MDSVGCNKNVIEVPCGVKEFVENKDNNRDGCKNNTQRLNREQG